MQAIIKNARYTEAQATLNELSAAFNAAVADESRLLAALAGPADAVDPLQAGLRLLRGLPAAPRNLNGLNRELTAVRERLDVLRPAVEAQRAAVAVVQAELSAEANAKALPVHTKAIEAVFDALSGLRAALTYEATVRAEIEAAGYQCSLEAVIEPELNFADTESAASRLLRDVTRRLEVERLRTGGPVNARLLVSVEGLGSVGDVMRVNGETVAHLVALGHGEATQAKPSKAPRPVAVTEVVLS